MYIITSNLCQYSEQVILNGRIYHESLRCNNPDTCKNALLYMIVILMVQFLYLVNHNTDTLYLYVKKKKKKNIVKD